MAHGGETWRPASGGVNATAGLEVPLGKTNLLITVLLITDYLASEPLLFLNDKRGINANGEPRTVNGEPRNSKKTRHQFGDFPVGALAILSLLWRVLRT
jgi:hypothetical protein